MSKDNTIIMTKGNPYKLMLRFALPLMLGNVFQQMYTLVDTMVVGKGVGVDALASVGAADWLNWMCFGMVGGLAQGFAIPVAQKFGAGHKNTLRKSIGNIFFVSAVCSLVMVILFQLLALPVLLLPVFRYVWVTRLLAVMGVVLVGVPMWFCETGSPFSLPVLVGAALLLRYGADGIVGRFLRWRPLQQVGAISFSLYLVHWPVFALWKYAMFDEIGKDDMVGMVAVSVVVGSGQELSVFKGKATV